MNGTALHDCCTLALLKHISLSIISCCFKVQTTVYIFIFILTDKLTLKTEICFLPTPLHARTGERKTFLHLVRKLSFLYTTLKLSCAIVTENDLLIMCHFKEKSLTLYCILILYLQDPCHHG